MSDLFQKKSQNATSNEDFKRGDSIATISTKQGDLLGIIPLYEDGINARNQKVPAHTELLKALGIDTQVYTTNPIEFELTVKVSVRSTVAKPAESVAANFATDIKML